jgi:hypothetical protein
MGTTFLPSDIDNLFTLAADMADGLHHLEATLGIKENTEAALRADLAVAADALKAFLTADATKKSLATSQTIADSNGKAFIATAKRDLADTLGDRWSSAWEAAGFRDRSLAIPVTVEERETLLGELSKYFAKNPGNGDATRAESLYVALKSARNIVRTANTAAGIAKTLCDTTLAALRNRMLGVISELNELLPANDPRWYNFGLNAPGEPQSPDAPENIVLTGSSPGSRVIHVNWSHARRAERYRVSRQVIGKDPTFMAVVTVTDSAISLNSMPSGATVNIRVTAINEAGESAPSAIAQIVVP